MNNPLEERLSQLKSQYAAGERELEQLQQREKELQSTLLRVSGGVQVLEEEIEKARQSSEKR